MLVLSRKVGQEIQIGSNIRLSVIKVGKDRVQIGIDAPKEVSIRRKELDDQKNIDTLIISCCDAIEAVSRINQSTTKPVCW